MAALTHVSQPPASKDACALPIVAADSRQAVVSPIPSYGAQRQETAAHGTSGAAAAHDALALVPIVPSGSVTNVGGVARSKVATYVPRPLPPQSPPPILPPPVGYGDFLQRYVAKYGIGDVAYAPGTIHAAHLRTTYNVDPGAPTDQKSSGRCWIFAGLTMMRVPMLKTYGKEFSYSHNFISFWDKYERANNFLEKTIMMGDRSVRDPAMVEHLEHAFTEGGEWELFVNLVDKYGVVPSYAMPETEASNNSSMYLTPLKIRLREAAGVLHKMAQQGDYDGAQRYKQQVMAQVRSLLRLYLGAPPKTFEWQPPQDPAAPLMQMTPLLFRAANPTYFANLVHLTHLPYVQTNVRVQIPEATNMVEGECLRGLNVGMDVMQEAIRRSIKGGDLVFCGIETQHLDREKRLWSLCGDQSDALFGGALPYRLSKGDRLLYRTTGVAHAVALMGCDDVGTRRRDVPSPFAELNEPMWRIVNSWKDRTDIYATNRWLEEYLYDIIVDRKYLPESVVALATSKSTPVVTLPASDPFGRL